MTTPDGPTSLRRMLSELAASAHPVDLSARVARSRRRLRRQRAAASGLATVAIIGAGGFAWQHSPSGSHGLQPGGATVPTRPTLATSSPPTEAGWFAYAPLPSVVSRVTGGLSGGPSTASGPSHATPPPIADVPPSSAAGRSTSAGATARPPSATPPGTVPAGHGCASPWTDESSGAGSPFASSAQREAAAAMGTALCGHLGTGSVTQLSEWVTMGGVGHIGQGVTYDVQATAAAGSVYLVVFRGTERGSGTAPVVSTESGALRAQWPDGTVVLMTKGEDTSQNRAVVVDPAFDVFRG